MPVYDKCWNLDMLPPTPKGCICPPTAEQTCLRSDCGRKDRAVTVSNTTADGKIKVDTCTCHGRHSGFISGGVAYCGGCGKPYPERLK